MNQNIINNVSPILALKAYYVENCHRAGLGPNSPPSQIPHIEINRSLTTSIPGFTDDYVLSWVNAIIKTEAFVLVRMLLDKKPTYMIFRIKMKTTTQETPIEAVDEYMKFPTDGELMIYPTPIMYDANTSEAYAIADVYKYNALMAYDWVDCMTPTKDNLEMLELIKASKCKLPKTIPKENRSPNLIFTNTGVLPRPDVIVTKCTNLVTGVEYGYKHFTSAVSRKIIQKAKVNERESDNEGEDDE